jgi:sulfoxide reductase heme-binding subunit YedZ
MTEIDHTYWYLNRAGGIVAYFLLFVALSLGLSLTGGALERFLRRYRVYDFHRFVSLLALGASLLHVFIVLPDRYASFGLADLLLPFASSYRPAYMALGILSLYLIGVIILAFYLRHLVTYRGWRLIHYATFAAFMLALVHGIGAGTDTPTAWAQYLYAATAIVAFNLLVYRLLRRGARAERASGFPERASVSASSADAFDTLGTRL